MNLVADQPADECEDYPLHDAIDWSASLEKSQDCETGGSRSEMLERMSAQYRANRIDLLVKYSSSLANA